MRPPLATPARLHRGRQAVLGGTGKRRCHPAVVEWLSHGQPVASKSFTREKAGTRWQRVRLTADTADGQDQQVRVRFIDPPPDSGVEGGVDDVVISVVLDCVDCCDGDMDADGSVNQDDVAYLVGVVGGGENPSGVDPDFNHDGNIDQDDVAALIGYVAGAGCP